MGRFSSKLRRIHENFDRYIADTRAENVIKNIQNEKEDIVFRNDLDMRFLDLQHVISDLERRVADLEANISRCKCK